MASGRWLGSVSIPPIRPSRFPATQSKGISLQRREHGTAALLEQLVLRCVGTIGHRARWPGNLGHVFTRQHTAESGIRYIYGRSPSSRGSGGRWSRERRVGVSSHPIRNSNQWTVAPENNDYNCGSDCAKLSDVIPTSALLLPYLSYRERGDLSRAMRLRTGRVTTCV